MKAAQPKPVQYPDPQLRMKIVSIVSELQGFLGERAGSRGEKRGGAHRSVHNISLGGRASKFPFWYSREPIF
jgi:hypothetical protein